MTQSDINQAMILAAGKGTRMRPLTLHTPKPLINVAGQPLIVWHILALKAAGIDNIVINCSYLSDKLIESLGDGNQYGVNIYWSIEETPLETAGGIAKALSDGKLKNEPFILVNGDVWSSYDFSKLRQIKFDYNKESSNQVVDQQLAHLLLVNNPDHNPNGDFSLANGKLCLDTSKSKFTFAGISIISPKLLYGISPSEPSALAPLIKQAMVNGHITADIITDKWVDVGTPERLERVNDYVEHELATGLHKGQLL